MKRLFTVNFFVDYGPEYGALEESLVIVSNNGDGEKAIARAKAMALKNKLDDTDDEGNLTGTKTAARSFKLIGLTGGDWIDG